MWWKNKLVIAAAVFAVLLAITLLTYETPYEAKSQTFEGVLPVIEEGSLDKVEITKGEDSYTAERRGEDWWITQPAEYKSDPTFKQVIVEKLEKLKLTRQASTKKEKHETFEVDDKGVRVKAFSGGKEVLSLIMGKQTVDYTSTFVRLPDSEAVYVAEGSMSMNFKRTVKDWRDKYILNFSHEDIAEISFEKKGGAKYTFIAGETTPAPPPEGAQPEQAPPMDEKTWKLAGKETFKVDKNRLTTTLNTFSKMRWNEVEDTPKELSEYGLDKPEVTVAVKTKDGKTYRVIIVQAKEEGEGEDAQFAWIKVDEDPKVYQVRKYQFDRFLKDVSYYNAEGQKKEK